MLNDKEMDIRWKSTDELPMDKEQYTKILLLSESRIGGKTDLHVSTNYWQVFFYDRDVNAKMFDKKRKLSDKCISYGVLAERGIQMEKVKGWMPAEGICVI